MAGRSTCPWRSLCSLCCEAGRCSRATPLDIPSIRSCRLCTPTIRQGSPYNPFLTRSWHQICRLRTPNKLLNQDSWQGRIDHIRLARVWTERFSWGIVCRFDQSYSTGGTYRGGTPGKNHPPWPAPRADAILQDNGSKACRCRQTQIQFRRTGTPGLKRWKDDTFPVYTCDTCRRQLLFQPRIRWNCSEPRSICLDGASGIDLARKLDMQSPWC